jgi:hypothetical protein
MQGKKKLNEKKIELSLMNNRGCMHFGDRMIINHWQLKSSHKRSFPDRIYTNETRLDGFYLNEINNSIHKTVLNSFFPVKTEAKGDF